MNIDFIPKPEVKVNKPKPKSTLVTYRHKKTEIISESKTIIKLISLHWFYRTVFVIIVGLVGKSSIENAYKWASSEAGYFFALYSNHKIHLQKSFP